MAIILSPLPSTRDNAALYDARTALLTARAAVSEARSQCRSYTAHDRLGDLVIELELAVESVHGIAESVFDEDDEREARSADARNWNFRYARA